MNFDEFMMLFGRESDDIEEAEVVETPAEVEAEAEAEAENDTVTATDDNNSADLDGDHESTAFVTDEDVPEEHEEADVDLDPATDILEEIAEKEEDGFQKQMEIPTVVDDDTVFDELQELTDVQVHNDAEKEKAILDDLEGDMDALLSDSGDTYDETEFDEIPENPSAEKAGGVDPLNPAEHPVTAMLDERIEELEEDGMLSVSTKDSDGDASEFLAKELNDDDTYSCDGSDDCECSNCDDTPAEVSADEVPESVTEDEDGDVVPKDAEPEEDEKEEESKADDEDVDVDAEAEKLEDDSDEATDEKIEAGDTSDIEISEDDAPAEDAVSDDGDADEGNIFDDPETFEITDDVVDNVRMPEYTFVPSVTLDEHEPEVADAETMVHDDDVDVEEKEPADETPLGSDGETSEVSEEPAEDTEVEAEVSETEEESESEEEEDDAPAVTKEEPAEVVEDDEEEVKAAEECDDTDVVPTDATPEDSEAEVSEEPTADDVETIDASIKNDDEASIQELYKDVEDVIVVGDDESALDGSSDIVGDEPSEDNNDAPETSENPAEYQDIEEVELGSQDLSDILEDLEDEPHNIESEGGDDVASDDVPAEAEVAEEPTEDVETEETSTDTEDEADEVEEADEAIESLFANLDGFRL